MTTDLNSIADAFAAVKAEQAPDETGGADPAVATSEQAPATGQEQAGEASGPDGELQGVIDSMLEADDGGQESAGPIDLNQTIPVSTVDGERQVRLQDLRDGYMMRADYTQKTQALAEDRKRLDQAEAFMKAYTDDPQEFARAIGEETGWLQPGQRPIKEIDGVKLPTDEDYEAEVQRRLEQKVEELPEVQEGRAAKALREINQEFDRIGSKHSVNIPADVRRAIMQEARDRGVNDLEILFEARIARARDRQRQNSDLRRSAPSRPGQAPLAASQDGSAPPEITTIEDAWAAAAAEVEA